MSSDLTDTQRRALAHVASHAVGDPIDPALRVTLHFHPDRGGLLDDLARRRLYRNQFETGTSNGGLTAHPGGDRWRWEQRMFAGAYDGAAPGDRPKYGALDVRRRSVGAAPRFGSAFLRLRPEVLDRTTFCFPDSVQEPTDVGVRARGSHVVALALGAVHDALDDYVEAQVHGPVRLPEDVEAIVLDPAYRGTEVEVEAHRACPDVAWHAGFRLGLDALRAHPDYRGPEFVELGIEVVRRFGDGTTLDPRVLGHAVRTGEYDLQDLKRVWHLLARFGTPELAGTTSGRAEG
ncbi:conserved hypothetical protein [Beutenbergia cavernae DSM 12333]|uniref:DUF3626 domain-containing protein n=1 Tax=Beutenbergia cavernae (strain ATCC BAA-8 / DSM 12333 / CCUG 43141 / JCM 11478 / NBRC 16432 / NCIMB 13614 / HKI 0122) TaxID=471853 RepID=C5C3S8_BEUC1|nr:DUF3626 domain-containing protein [Beutenbergia cavernae]ACQ81987.1 conserved hypothetical protein [Beutenbergia cavernae DSM 12333]